MFETNEYIKFFYDKYPAPRSCAQAIEQLMLMKLDLADWKFGKRPNFDALNPFNVTLVLPVSGRNTGKNDPTDVTRCRFYLQNEIAYRESFISQMRCSSLEEITLTLEFFQKKYPTANNCNEVKSQIENIKADKARLSTIPQSWNTIFALSKSIISWLDRQLEIKQEILPKLKCGTAQEPKPQKSFFETEIIDKLKSPNTTSNKIGLKLTDTQKKIGYFIGSLIVVAGIGIVLFKRK